MLPQELLRFLSLRCRYMGIALQTLAETGFVGEGREVARAFYRECCGARQGRVHHAGAGCVGHLCVGARARRIVRQRLHELADLLRAGEQFRGGGHCTQ